MSTRNFPGHPETILAFSISPNPIFEIQLLQCWPTSSKPRAYGMWVPALMHVSDDGTWEEARTGYFGHR